MIAGIYRLRFRVTDSKNPFVEESQRRQLQTNRAAFRRLNTLRNRTKLEGLKEGKSTLQSSLISL